MLKKTKNDLRTAVSRTPKFPKTFSLTPKSIQKVMLSEMETMARDFRNDMEATLSYKFQLTVEIATGQSIEIKKTNINTKKMSSSVILPLGFYNHKKRLFKWSGPTDIFYDKLMNQIAAFDMDVFEAATLIKPLFAQTIKTDKKTFEYIPMFHAAFNPAFHLIKFHSVDENNKPNLTMYSLVRLPKNSSVTNDKFSKYMDFLQTIMSLTKLKKKLKKKPKKKIKKII